MTDIERAARMAEASKHFDEAVSAVDDLRVPRGFLASMAVVALFWLIVGVAIWWWRA